MSGTVKFRNMMREEVEAESYDWEVSKSLELSLQRV